MKRKFLILVMTICMLVFTACASGKGEIEMTPTPTAAVEVTNEPEPTEQPTNAPATAASENDGEASSADGEASVNDGGVSQNDGEIQVDDQSLITISPEAPTEEHTDYFSDKMVIAFSRFLKQYRTEHSEFAETVRVQPTDIDSDGVTDLLLVDSTDDDSDYHLIKYDESTNNAVETGVFKSKLGLAYLKGFPIIFCCSDESDGSQTGCVYKINGFENEKLCEVYQNYNLEKFLFDGEEVTEMQAEQMLMEVFSSETGLEDPDSVSDALEVYEPLDLWSIYPDEDELGQMAEIFSIEFDSTYIDTLAPTGFEAIDKIWNYIGGTYTDCSDGSEEKLDIDNSSADIYINALTGTLNFDFYSEVSGYEIIDNYITAELIKNGTDDGIWTVQGLSDDEERSYDISVENNTKLLLIVKIAKELGEDVISLEFECPDYFEYPDEEEKHYGYISLNEAADCDEGFVAFSVQECEFAESDEYDFEIVPKKGVAPYTIYAKKDFTTFGLIDYDISMIPQFVDTDTFINVLKSKYAGNLFTGFEISDLVEYNREPVAAAICEEYLG